MSKPGKVILKWTDFGRLMNDLIDKLKYARLPVTHVYGPPVGGVFVAGVIANKLNLKYVTFTGPLILKPKRLLIVDDLTDTGQTMRDLIPEQYRNDVYTAALYWKPHKNGSKWKPNVFVHQTLNWIVFPWERLDEKPNRPGYEHLE